MLNPQKVMYWIFICLVSTAVHIKVVSDITSVAFLAAFARFKSRRGNCSRLYSYDGSNFEGASNELHRLFKKASSFSEEIAAAIAKN